MFKQFTQMGILAVLISNLYSICGVLFLNWSVADLFFWFWCEFVLVGVTMIVLTLFWVRVDKTSRPEMAKIAPFLTVFSFLLILFYATLFTGMTYMGEWKSWNRFPEFLTGKKIALLALALVFAGYLVMTLAKQDYGLEESRHVVQLYMRKSIVILGIYALLMFQYHLTGARRLNLTSAYLKWMGMILLSLKLLAEAGLFDRFCKPRPKRI